MKEKEEVKEEKLSDKEIVEFYHKVLLRFENRIKNIENDDENKCKTTPVSLLKREESKGIENNYKINIISSYTSFEENELYENDTIKIYFDPKGKGEQPKIHPHTYYFIYSHLRNSFAHGHITKENGYYLLHDRTYNDGKNKLSLVAKIKEDDFFKFIDEIYDTSKKHKEVNNN